LSTDSQPFEYIRDLFRNRLVIFQLARQDFHNRYVGSMLGLVWSFVQPLVMTLILWTVFSLAFKTATVHGVPFVLWLLAGLAVWNLFSESLTLATGVFQEYAFLVKKVQFKIAVLPMVKILSSLAVHGVFMLIVMGILLVNGIPVSWYWLQIPYYLLALVVLLQGLSWITAALNVFVKDVGYIVNVMLQFGFWLTPIFWELGMLPAPYRKYLVVLKLNPLVYIVEGYRNSLLTNVPCWSDGLSALYFWGVALAMLALGAFIFRKLKPHFADVL
jgi:lipopolysaccharide transport system permease protein/teichoic acid transport system permease protein